MGAPQGRRRASRPRSMSGLKHWLSTWRPYDVANTLAAATVGATLYARQHETLNDPFVDATNATLKPVHQARILRGGPAWREGNAAHHAPTTPTLAARTGDHGGLER